MTRAFYASDPAQSRGRLHPEKDSAVRGPRDAFQRDRDRVIHSISFRRLRHKTQVFIAPDGDHYRVRLTHSLEVAQIGRAIARALGLNEDLTEALCLAHDIGHPPFGHAGERALNDVMADCGGFDHNAQTLRTLMQLDSPYPDRPGLNLSWEVMEGLAKHNGPLTEPGWSMVECDAALSLELGSHASLEAQIAAIADDIAYDNHDIDDGIRAGFLGREQLMELPFLAELWADIRSTYPDAGDAALLREMVRSQIGLMVNDVIAATKDRIAKHNIASADNVRKAGLTIGGFSDAMTVQERELKRFMYANLYLHPDQQAAADCAHDIIAELALYYRADPMRLPEDWRPEASEDDIQTGRRIIDFIAGMTDRYAINRYAENIGPVPKGLRNV
ncbi:deoxyguanosinetriphosphate triphosphohydrolase [Alterisphingorhabdus coralli]|uniref:Deoxyguanosinetriphosphate triphosphohydrolase-like protein n=1 Tax=Alterisphingorhabdus coralli TaxID=3071408 RepID=A0AA97F7Z5_9SPHN|nr:deoxyguanosinetriphosphate triphosphohydrolase [Parasphingorhabdus sp. SCSIO 66989]WOE74200.1 deoxyguanosinetriphosphate triphosphohydrolase [Parasphingorhabdus sp. SCSIO 66989]